MGGGRFARAFVGVNKGWVPSAGGQPSAEELRDNIDVIRNLDSYEIPGNANDEVKLLFEALQG